MDNTQTEQAPEPQVSTYANTQIPPPRTNLKFPGTQTTYKRTDAGYYVDARGRKYVREKSGAWRRLDKLQAARRGYK